MNATLEPRIVAARVARGCLVGVGRSLEAEAVSQGPGRLLVMVVFA
jgi:hypothetical protein